MAKEHEYTHTVQYYETDRMGIVHHSNYIRWMEETRVAVLDRFGCGYGEMEKRGIISPVVSVNCRYKEPTEFGDVIKIKGSIESYNGIRLKIKYVMTNERTGNVCAEAESEHCFLSASGRPIHLGRVEPEFDEGLKRIMAD